MSNCIDIVYKYKVNLKPHQVDTVGLQNLINQAEKEINEDNSVSETKPSELKLAWWYLSKNTRFKGNGGVEINFGNGRSSHTWRSFRGTLHILKQFIKEDVWANFGLTDEYDGHETIIRVPVNLKEGLT